MVKMNNNKNGTQCAQIGIFDATNALVTDTSFFGISNN